MEWLERISVTCFTASYLLVFALEISRALFKANWWRWIVGSISVAGIFAHVVYLASQRELTIHEETGVIFSGWTGWFLVAAVFVMVAYLWLLLRQRDSIIGLFLIPLALICVAIGNWPGQQNAFSIRETRNIWNTIHGFSFLFSTVIVGLGFLFGLMYLIQARRLKRSQVLTVRMPSLEWLQQSGEKSLVVSAVLLLIGVVSGFAINIINRIQGIFVISWQDPVVWTSGALLIWLLVVIVTYWFYRPARPGKKVSYLVISCFLFLVLEIGIVLLSGHATPAELNSTPIAIGAVE